LELVVSARDMHESVTLNRAPNRENLLSHGKGKLQWRLLTILTEHERSPASHASRFSRGLTAKGIATRLVVHPLKPKQWGAQVLRRRMQACRLSR
jgi:hypothetical protein